MRAPRPEPRIAVGMACLSCALRARTGSLARGEAAGLLARVGEVLPDDSGLLGAILDFSQAPRGDQVAAGTALQDFLTSWACTLPGARRPQRHFDWQDRKDVNG